MQRTPLAGLSVLGLSFVGWRRAACVIRPFPSGLSSLPSSCFTAIAHRKHLFFFLPSMPCKSPSCSPFFTLFFLSFSKDVFCKHVERCSGCLDDHRNDPLGHVTPGSPPPTSYRTKSCIHVHVHVHASNLKSLGASAFPNRTPTHEHTIQATQARVNPGPSQT